MAYVKGYLCLELVKIPVFCRAGRKNTLNPKQFFGAVLFVGVLVTAILVVIGIRGGVLSDPFHPQQSQQISRPATSRSAEPVVRLNQSATVRSEAEPAKLVSAEELKANSVGYSFEPPMQLEVRVK
ncbi:MAG: hypothetical protein A2571_00060 [Candidatus Vogelbacteria bacterium RIFOXYD1_FULL_44_32]|uniref:Uncharacterized protein n=1 Tax=Candidatus Vogelbacteria bacterium RIFOXYD1_FULL_44_32 TaxID=1802438 RepID=A0A1G2QFM8_9BACT|nr:MAG: hypothetical protein A2571_00060 [Candidatus Vogelbacteria bacterium RIFOXYD1_FULL_44_32]